MGWNLKYSLEKKWGKTPQKHEGAEIEVYFFFKKKLINTKGWKWQFKKNGYHLCILAYSVYFAKPLL